MKSSSKWDIKTLNSSSLLFVKLTNSTIYFGAERKDLLQSSGDPRRPPETPRANPDKIFKKNEKKNWNFVWVCQWFSQNIRRPPGGSPDNFRRDNIAGSHSTYLMKKGIWNKCHFRHQRSSFWQLSLIRPNFTLPGMRQDSNERWRYKGTVESEQSNFGQKFQVD